MSCVDALFKHRSRTELSVSQKDFGNLSNQQKQSVLVEFLSKKPVL